MGAWYLAVDTSITMDNELFITLFKDVLCAKLCDFWYYVRGWVEA